MKPFNLVIIVSVVGLLAAMIWFQNGLLPDEQPTIDQQISTEKPELQMDLLNYINYSEDNLDLAQRKGRSVLFFAATIWCQTCSALEEEILERNSELPSDVTILKVDFDRDQDMRNRHGATVQHTLIVLDDNGEEVKRWVGGGFDAMLQQLAVI